MSLVSRLFRSAPDDLVSRASEAPAVLGTDEVHVYNAIWEFPGPLEG